MLLLHTAFKPTWVHLNRQSTPASASALKSHRSTHPQQAFAMLFALAIQIARLYKHGSKPIVQLQASAQVVEGQ
jgi:hypothetical protein